MTSIAEIRLLQSLYHRAELKKNDQNFVVLRVEYLE